jgi:hypothetical protein
LDFLYKGYNIRFIQKERCKDKSAHLETYIFKFFSSKTQYHYIIRAELHEEEIFAVKFYCKKDRKSDFKYTKVVNRGDLGNIVISCLKVIPYLLQKFPGASFGFIGARGYDPEKKVYEQIEITQRFRIWTYIVTKKIGHVLFRHIQYPSISGYLLLNKSVNFPESIKENQIKTMFINTYSGTDDLLS